MIKNIAVVEWRHSIGISQNIHVSLLELGYNAVLFDPAKNIPQETQLIFSYGPYGNLINIFHKKQSIPPDIRPLLIHWDTEGMPNYLLPKWFVCSAGKLRSWFGSIGEYNQGLAELKTYQFLNSKACRYRYFGDYQYGYSHKYLDQFIEYSLIYTQAHRRFGIPAEYVPWGTSKNEWQTLNLDRDIDILWMGKCRSKSRADQVQKIYEAVTKAGYKMLIVDGVHHPYIFGNQRTEILNRSKITLNLLPAWDFNNFPFRFHLAAPNRSLVISDILFPHNPEYKPGFHYVSAPREQLPEIIIYYLQHVSEREEIVDQAFHLTVNEMTMTQSVRKILALIKNDNWHEG